MIIINKLMIVGFLLSLFFGLIAMVIDVISPPYGFGGRIFETFKTIGLWVMGILFIVPILYAVGFGIFSIMLMEF